MRSGERAELKKKMPPTFLATSPDPSDVGFDNFIGTLRLKNSCRNVGILESKRRHSKFIFFPILSLLS